MQCSKGETRCFLPELQPSDPWGSAVSTQDHRCSQERTALRRNRGCIGIELITTRNPESADRRIRLPTSEERNRTVHLLTAYCPEEACCGAFVYLNLDREGVVLLRVSFKHSRPWSTRCRNFRKQSHGKLDLNLLRLAYHQASAHWRRVSLEPGNSLMLL